MWASLYQFLWFMTMTLMLKESISFNSTGKTKGKNNTQHAPNEIKTNVGKIFFLSS